MRLPDKWAAKRDIVGNPFRYHLFGNPKGSNTAHKHQRNGDLFLIGQGGILEIEFFIRRNDSGLPGKGIFLRAEMGSTADFNGIDARLLQHGSNLQHFMEVEPVFQKVVRIDFDHYRVMIAHGGTDGVQDRQNISGAILQTASVSIRSFIIKRR